MFKNLQSVTAPDKYTVVIQFAPGTSPEVIIEMLEAQSGTDPSMEAQEVVAAGKINDWHYAIGTGPFILESFVSGSFRDPGQETPITGEPTSATRRTSSPTSMNSSTS